MVATHNDAPNASRCFVLRPDIAIHWRQTVRIFAFMALVCLGIGSAFAWLGFWPILGFAGLEMVALGAALYVSAQRGLDREVVRVTRQTVDIEKGRRRPQFRWRFQRLWTEAVLIPTGHRWYPPRLTIRSGGEQVELGRFLLAEERERVARELIGCIGPMAALGSDLVPKEGEAQGGVLNRSVG